MVNLILTKTIDSKYILEKMKPYALNKKYLIIVPDRIVLSYEMLVLDYLKLPGAMNIEVRSFRTLADAVLKENEAKTLNQQTEIMLIRKIIEDNSGKFLYYKKASSFVGFAKEVLDLIALIRGNGISIDQIRNLSNKLPPKYHNKTSDILLIYESYMNLLNEGYSDYISKLENLRDAFKDSEYSSYDIFISEFDTFSKIELDIIDEMIRSVAQINITLPYSKEKNDYLFPKQTADDIKALARIAGQKCIVDDVYEKEDLGENREVIYKELFGFSNYKSEKRIKNIEIQFAKNPEEEIKALAIQIKALVKKGFRYKDIACVCCDVANYSATIESVFKKYNIPFFADTKEQLVNQNLSKLLINALKVIINNYSQADVFAFMKELDAIIDRNDLNEFENYCLQYGIEYETKFKQPFVCVADVDRQDRVNKTRVKLLDILSPLYFKECIDVKDSVACIRAFMEKIDAQKLSDDLSKEQLDLGYNIESSVTKQVPKKIYAVLDQFDAMLGSVKMPLQRFFKILESTLASVTITTIPMYIDCVYVGDLQKSRYERKDYIFIVGANDGVFPVEAQEGGLLTSQEFESWRMQGVNIYPSIKDVNRDAKLNVLMVLLKPKKGLVISYPMVDMQTNKLEISNAVKELLSIINQVDPQKQEPEAIGIDTPSDDWTLEKYAWYVGSRKNALEVYLELKAKIEDNTLSLTDTLKKVMRALYEMAKQDLNNDDKLSLLDSGKREIDGDIEGFSVLPKGGMSMSKFEKYLQCPFKYCIDNVLYLQEREIAGVKVQDTGTLLHKIFEAFFSRKDYDQMNEEEILTFVVNVLDKAIVENPAYSYLNDPEYKNVYNSLISNATTSIKILVKKMEVSAFKPYLMEARFADTENNGKKPIWKSMDIGDGIKINGEVDRIDLCDNGGKKKVLVIDYKTKADVSFTTNDVKYGHKLQPLIYLMEVTDAEKAIPAGALYLSLQDSVNSKSKEDRLKYSGLIINSDNIIADLDNTLITNDAWASQLFPIKTKSKNNPTLCTPSDSNLVTKEEYEELCDYAIKMLKKVVKEMGEGFIKATPLAYKKKGNNPPEPCMYCKYKSMCGIESNPEKIRNINKNEQNDAEADNG